MLVTAFDFSNADRRANLQVSPVLSSYAARKCYNSSRFSQQVMTQLLDLGVVPIINETDAVSANGGYQVQSLSPKP